MKKEEVRKVEEKDNSCGAASVVLGIMGLLSNAFGMIILGIVSLGFAVKQQQKSANSWSKAGMILAIIGIVAGIISVAFLLKNPDFIKEILKQQLVGAS